MSIFQKLKELNYDIALLEAHGDFKSASILHKKFVKEAQETQSSNSILTVDQEKSVYVRIINQIKALLQRQNIPAAMKLSNDYRNWFDNQDRNTQFQKQVDDLLARYVDKKSGLSESKPGKNLPTNKPAKLEDIGSESSLESPTLAPAIKFKNDLPELIAKPQYIKPNDKEPIADPVSAKLDVMVKNFWDNRISPGKSVDQIYEELKKDIHYRNVVRFHIKGSKHLDKDQILKLYNEKMK
jgi:hypothetical protein